MHLRKIQFSQIWYLQKMMKRKQCAYKCCFILGKGITFCESTNTARASTLILSCVEPRQRFILETCRYEYYEFNFKSIWITRHFSRKILRSASIIIEIIFILVLKIFSEWNFNFNFWSRLYIEYFKEFNRFEWLIIK